MPAAFVHLTSVQIKWFLWIQSFCLCVMIHEAAVNVKRSLCENKHAEIRFIKIFSVMWRKTSWTKWRSTRNVYLCDAFLSESQENLGGPWGSERPQRYTWRTTSVLTVAVCLLCVCFILYFALGRKLICNLLGLGHTQTWDVQRPAEKMCGPAALCIWSRAADLKTASGRKRRNHHGCNWQQERY